MVHSSFIYLLSFYRHLWLLKVNARRFMVHVRSLGKDGRPVVDMWDTHSKDSNRAEEVLLSEVCLLDIVWTVEDALVSWIAWVQTPWNLPYQQELIAHGFARRNFVGSKESPSVCSTLSCNPCRWFHHYWLLQTFLCYFVHLRSLPLVIMYHVTCLCVINVVLYTVFIFSFPLKATVTSFHIRCVVKFVWRNHHLRCNGVPIANRLITVLPTARGEGRLDSCLCMSVCLSVWWWWWPNLQSLDKKLRSLLNQGSTGRKRVTVKNASKQNPRLWPWTRSSVMWARGRSLPGS